MGQVQQFVNEWNEKYCNQIADPYKNQCVEVPMAFLQQFIGGKQLSGNAIDFAKPGNYDPTKWKWVENTPSGVPKPGCIMVWGTLIDQFGHTALFINGNVNAFNSFDQNWPLNSPCHIEAHNYRGVLGWLAPLEPIY